MNTIPHLPPAYRSPARPSRTPFHGAFPTFFFYARFLDIVVRASIAARRGCFTDAMWCRSSHGVIRALEGVGVRLTVTGGRHLRAVHGPCVIIGNHMSMLETQVLPAIVQPVKPVTFVIKESLLRYPVFRHIMRSRDPIAVGRINPRKDFQTVLREGKRRLERGVSVIVFPQTTRTTRFDPARFNTIGVKLALRAGVPVLPLALRTDAWANGPWIKEFGRIAPLRTVRFAFGPPLWPAGRGHDVHAAVIRFIAANLGKWR